MDGVRLNFSLQQMFWAEADPGAEMQDDVAIVGAEATSGQGDDPSLNNVKVGHFVTDRRRRYSRVIVSARRATGMPNLRTTITFSAT